MVGGIGGGGGGAKWIMRPKREVRLLIGKEAEIATGARGREGVIEADKERGKRGGCKKKAG